MPSSPFTSLNEPRQLTVAHEAWGVHEDLRVEAPHYGPSLVFDNGRVARRVRCYPETWRELSDEQLYALSWSR